MNENAAAISALVLSKELNFMIFSPLQTYDKYQSRSSIVSEPDTLLNLAWKDWI